jgi:hypothetical protein
MVKVESSLTLTLAMVLFVVKYLFNYVRVFMMANDKDLIGAIEDLRRTIISCSSIISGILFAGIGLLSLSFTKTSLDFMDYGFRYFFVFLGVFLIFKSSKNL